MYEINYLDIEKDIKYEKIIEQVLQECFKIEKLLNSKLIVNVILTTPIHIKELNKKYRNINEETDVLSFPMFEKKDIDRIIKQGIDYNDILGDMVISIPRVKKQAIEYGHSFNRELAYMVVHSFYHLMGYDHIYEEDRVKMRTKEEFLLNKLNITR